MSKRYNIVCLSSQFYRRKDDLWTNKQHIMKRLSATNKILYMNRPSRFSLGRCFRLRSLLPFLERESDSLWVFWSFNVSAKKFARGWKINEWINIALLRRYIEKLGMKDDLILWFYMPELVYLLGKLGEKFVIYDCVDIIEAFPCYADPALRSQIVEKERRLVSKADLVFATTDTIYQDKKILNRNTYLVPNVGDFEHFSSALDPGLRTADEIARLKKPVVGFIGAVTDYKLDVTLLEEMARDRPGWSIALIGPLHKPCDRINSSLLGKLENVHFMGKVSYERLPAYVKGFDVCIIPYAINEYTRGVFPIKFFEYLATGRPVVSTPLPSLLGYRRLAYFGENSGSFIGAVEVALRERDEGIVRERIDAARGNSWQNRIQKIMGLIERHWPGSGRR